MHPYLLYIPDKNQFLDMMAGWSGGEPAYCYTWNDFLCGHLHVNYSDFYEKLLDEIELN
jgi:hypothetical protein